MSSGGRTVTAPLTVRMDPRVTTPPEGLARQFSIASEIAGALKTDFDALQQVREHRARLKGNAAAAELDAELAALEGKGGRRRGANAEDLSGLNGKLAGLYATVSGTDAPPTTQAVDAWQELQKSLSSVLARWEEAKAKTGARAGGSSPQ